MQQYRVHVELSSGETHTLWIKASSQSMALFKMGMLFHAMDVKDAYATLETN